MQIVKRFAIGETPSVIRTLKQNEIDRFYKVLVKNKGTFAERTAVKQLADFIRDKQAWLACSCKFRDRALMSLGLSAKGNYYLIRMTSRVAHARGCRFDAERIASSHAKTASKRVSATVPLCLHRVGDLNTLSQDTKKVARQTSSRGGHHYPTIGNLLLTLIDKAQMNRLSTERYPEFSQYLHVLKEVASQMELDKRVPLYKYLWTYPDIAKMAAQLQKVQPMWPKTTKPHAICMTVVDEVAEQTLRIKMKGEINHITVHGRLSASSGRLGEGSDPYLAIFSVTQAHEDADHYQAMSGFFIPVYSKAQWVPIDSRYERLVLKALHSWCCWWQKKQLTVDVIKPLFNISCDYQGESFGVKPDFLIRTPKKTIVLEVMGSHENTYLERKDRLLPIMSSLGEVIEFDALAAETEGEWDVRLERVLKTISALVFSGNRKGDPPIKQA